MPILAESKEPSRRRSPWVLVALMSLLLMPLVLFVWSWFRPISFDNGVDAFGFGAVYSKTGFPPAGWHRLPGIWLYTVNLPGGKVSYYVQGTERRSQP